MALRDDLRTFPGIQPAAFQHPFDAAALAALKRVPLLDRVMKMINNVDTRIRYLLYVGNSVQVGPNQYNRLYRQYLRMAEIIDVQRLPRLFVAQSPIPNAFAVGMDDYMIVVNTGLIDILSEDELLAVLGHELGHVKCEHMLYKTMAVYLIQSGPMLLDFLPLPATVGQLALRGLIMSLYEWSRKAEFSCDRVGALVTQEPELMQMALAKLAGHTIGMKEDINIDAMIAQGRDYHEYGADDWVDRFVKFYVMMNDMDRTHPLIPLRVSELETWKVSEHYNQIMRGEYHDLVRDGAELEETVVEPIPVVTARAAQCPKCNTFNPDNAMFCTKCATNMRDATMFCATCRNPVMAEWKVCAGCGNRLTA